MSFTRHEIADIIFKNLKDNEVPLKKQFIAHKNQIGFFYLDALLPEKIALEIYKKMPVLEDTIQRKNIRERKFTAFQMNTYNPFLEAVIYAFQEEKIVRLISQICEIPNLVPDENLYAGGISLMPKESFLNPHLDNSHDKQRENWRVLNLLYYVTPDWVPENGGNLEIWPNGLKEKQITIASTFNRFVVMATHQNSWHSVSPVLKNKLRCCISNYYFSKEALLPSDTFHITTFRGWPKERLKDFFLQIDNKVRTSIRFVFKKGIRENPHQYKK